VILDGSGNPAFETSSLSVTGGKVTFAVSSTPVYVEMEEATIHVSKDGLCNGNNPCFPNIQNGIASASAPSAIKITQETYNENIILDFNEVITLQGGWDTNFTSNSSYTAINGSITITNGKMTIEKIILK
jgi:hypothetical protein